MGSGSRSRCSLVRDDSGYVLSFPPAIKISLASWLVRSASSSRSRRAAAGSLSSTRWNRLRADHRAALQRGRGRGPFHRDDQCELADQRAGTGDDLGAAFLDPERAALHDIAGVGGIADIEQHLACVEVTLLGADRQHAQGAVAQQTHRRNPLKQGYVIIDRHSGPVTAVRLDFTNR